MDGQVVHLQRGDAHAKTVYSNDPVAFARKWEEAGGDWLHIVDLDAAFSGISSNLDVVAAICRSINIPCELGGGMRSAKAIENAFAAGVSRVVLGTRAAESLDFISEMAETHGMEKIAVGIDAKDGFVAIKGWKEATSLKATDFARKVQLAGAGTIIYTDIATDGMLQGPNFAALKEMAREVDLPIIASGGVSCSEDLSKLDALGCIHGTIIGKALYDGKITPPLKKKLNNLLKTN